MLLVEVFAYGSAHMGGSTRWKGTDISDYDLATFSKGGRPDEA